MGVEVVTHREMDSNEPLLLNRIVVWATACGIGAGQERPAYRRLWSDLDLESADRLDSSGSRDFIRGNDGIQTGVCPIRALRFPQGPKISGFVGHKIVPVTGFNETPFL